MTEQSPKADNEQIRKIETEEQARLEKNLLLQAKLRQIRDVANPAMPSERPVQEDDVPTYEMPEAHQKPLSELSEEDKKKLGVK